MVFLKQGIQPFVDIHLSVKNRQLAFFVKNSTEGFPREEKVKENIGLSNLRRQLELLLYRLQSVCSTKRVDVYSYFKN